MNALIPPSSFLLHPLFRKISHASAPARGPLGPSYEDMIPMPKVVFTNEKKEIEVPQGANLRKEAMKNGIEVYRGVDKYLHCPGWGLCGTCRVLVKKGMENLRPKG